MALPGWGRRIVMPRFQVSVTEVYVKMVAVEAPDSETAETLVRGRWDQGQIDPTDNGFDHVEVYCEDELLAEEGLEVTNG
jgi:hypothetical protein